MKPYYDDGRGIVIYHGDCREVLPELGSAYLAIFDPPYTFGLSSTEQSKGKSGGWGDLMNNALFYATILREIRRIVNNEQGAAWVFNSWRSFPVIARASFESDWPIESLLVWDKGPEVGMGGLRGLRSQYELVALFVTPAFRIANRSTKDIWNVPWGGSVPRALHPAQKPQTLIGRMIEASGAEGRLVVDPFAGSGTSLLAAKVAGCRAIGIEIEERYCEIAARRLSQEVLPLELVP